MHNKLLTNRRLVWFGFIRVTERFIVTQLKTNIPVVHHEDFQLLGVVNYKLLETIWEIVTGLLV